VFHKDGKALDDRDILRNIIRPAAERLGLYWRDSAGTSLHRGRVDTAGAGREARARAALRNAGEEGFDGSVSQNCVGLCGIMREDNGVENG
jgi:hypothetical protein